MANALYDTGRNWFLTGGATAGWGLDTRLILSDSADYTKDLANHDFLNDVAAGARVATSGAMSGKTQVAGVADAADVTFTSVSGDPSEELICYYHTGNEATAQLIFNLDTATGLPVTPGGGDIQVQWDNGANKIFKL